ncbi:MAG: TfoX/Sxy family protein [Desulforhopalus sp.]
MTAPNSDKEFVAHVVDLMQSLGPVYAKSMFGGHGIFFQGLMFGLVADNVLYLKVDTETEEEFKTQGLLPFTYNKKGKEFKMSYYQAPEETLEENEKMKIWAQKAYGAALRSVSKKPQK